MSNEVIANAQQIEYWNSVSGPKWVLLQEELDGQLAPLQEAFIQFADPRPREQVIDVGCGCGASTLELAGRVGSEGSALGVDVSGPMLARARKRAAQQNLAQCSFEEGDAQVYGFDSGGADLVTSRFGIMFFEDFVAAFKNLHGAIKPGGRMAFMCWRPMQENPWMTIPVMAAAQYVEMPPPQEDPHAPGPFALSDADYIRQVMSEAGFSEIEIEPLDRKLTVGSTGTLDDAIEFNLKIGPLSRILAEADEVTLAKVKDAIREALEPHLTDEGVKLDFAAWLVRGMA